MNFPSSLPYPRSSATYNRGSALKQTVFDYSMRTRRQPPVKSSFRASFRFTASELATFTAFYFTDLNTGLDSFTADWDFDNTATHDFLFDGAYQVVKTSPNNYDVSASFYIIS